ncbi:Lipopolysaccharide-modifying protein [Niveomyces insectorum RCEF 264]|uniref:Lipopolysaccharide-modifying protein n=1 Tax=Niveomyces insectorum RCEF 264 TaxID=1081102 RepID=A0A167T8C4_9HYPO|nr:Lipopolysaccharide-modifying protein [Niveomyces insectorum RCEF 264]
MGDILYPSPAYMESEFQYDRALDVAWQKKRNNLYWAGSTTGGFAVNDQWRNFHRQKFVSLAQNLERRPHVYLREQASDGVVRPVTSSFLNGRLFDALRSRLVFDIDGNGISGRYYKLLASNSAPLKQTILHEWHDERLVPWVHYIPVSQSLDELPELVAFLTSSASGAGQKLAKDVAEQGKDWYSKALREVDMAIYTYRLLLELARLQDPERPAGAATAASEV